MSVQPTPTISIENATYSGEANSEHFADSMIWHDSLQFSNLPHVGFCELRSTLTFASICRTVDKTISLIFGWRFPRKMFGIDATEVSIATRMSSLVFSGWRWSVNSLANKPRNVELFPADRDVCPAAFGVDVVGPCQTRFNVLVRDYDFAHISESFTGWRLAKHIWTSVLAPTKIMFVAIAVTIHALPTTLDRAYSLRFTHEPLPRLVVRRARRGLITSAPFVHIPQANGTFQRI